MSDAERDVAVRHLQRHYVEGRLTLDELDERVGLALGARTIGDLAAARLDLPGSTALPDGGDPCGGLPRKAFLTEHRVKIATAAALLTGVGMNA